MLQSLSTEYPDSLPIKISTPLAELQPHQWLAIHRGETEGALKVRFQLPDGEILDIIEAHIHNKNFRK